MSDSFANPMDGSPPSSSVPGISQARILEWVAISFSRVIFPPQGSNSDLPHCGQILYCLSHQGSPSHPLNLPESFCCPRTLRPSPPALKGPSTCPHCLATNLFLCATDVIPHSVMGQKPHGLSFMVVAIRERRGKKILN